MTQKLGVAFSNRFHLVANRYARAVNDAYKGDQEAAMRSNDATVAARVRGADAQSANYAEYLEKRRVEWNVSRGLEREGSRGRHRRHAQGHTRRPQGSPESEGTHL